MPSILLYTSPRCPDCAALKQWLTDQGLSYTELDLSRPGVADQAKAQWGVRVAPITVWNGQLFYGTARDQIPRLQALLTPG